MRKASPFEIIRQSSEQKHLCLSLYAHDLDDIAHLLAQARTLARKSHDEKDALQLIGEAESLRLKWPLAQMQHPTAVFLSPEFSAYAPMPFSLKNLVVLSRSFHIKPLIKWQQRQKPFALIFLHKGTVQLHICAAGDMRLVKKETVGQLPDSLRPIISGIRAALGDLRMPVILSGDDILVRYFRTELNPRKVLLDDRHNLRPHQSPLVLQETCLRLLEPYFRQQENRALRDYKVAKLERRTSSDLAAIVRFATLGQIDHLFINERIHLWGKIDISSGRCFHYSRQLDTSDDDVLDDLAEMVLQHQGQVTVLPSERMPDSFAAAAVLRGSDLGRIGRNAPIVLAEDTQEKSAFAF